MSVSETKQELESKLSHLRQFVVAATDVTTVTILSQEIKWLTDELILITGHTSHDNLAKPQVPDPESLCPLNHNVPPAVLTTPTLLKTLPPVLDVNMANNAHDMELTKPVRCIVAPVPSCPTLVRSRWSQSGHSSDIRMKVDTDSDSESSNDSDVALSTSAAQKSSTQSVSCYKPSTFVKPAKRNTKSKKTCCS